MSSPAKARQDLADQLAEILPADQYMIVPNVANVDRLAKRLVQIELSAFQPSTKARGVRAVEFTIHVATNLDGVTAAAEADAELAALEVFEALETFPWTNPQRAEKTVYKDKHLGFDITTEAIIRRS